MSAAVVPPVDGVRMSREVYRAWADAEPRGRFERIDGVVEAVAPERLGHLIRKGGVFSALRRAVRAAGLPCQVLPDGATIETGDSDFEPDAVLRCGEALDSGRVDVPDPLVIVEVLSPWTCHLDLSRKLVRYFRVPSLRHYLIFEADEALVIHHRRRDDGDGIETRILTAGEIRLDPPGVTITVGEVHGG